MDKLLSKLQYQFYEAGEFSAVAARSLEETNELIKSYPWEKECLITSVGVGMPGVVIEDASANYLKIGNYYYSQYCLYLFTHSGTYFIRIVETIEEVLVIAADFFNGKEIKADFNREHDLGIKKHFISKDFIYKVTGGRILKFLFFTIIATIPFTLLLLGFMDSPYFVAMFLTWLFICGINWLLFINYFFQSRTLFLKVSEGQNNFLFGTRSSYKEYNKDDIDSFFVYAWTGGAKGPPWIGFEVYKIIFKNGTELRFTSLLMRALTVPFKFRTIPMKAVQKFFPFSKMKIITQK